MMAANVFENLYQEELYVIPRGTLILIDREWTALTEEESALLTRILGAVKLTPAAVQILHTNTVDTRQLAALNPARIISFGPVVPGVSGLYQLGEVNGISVICADSLDRFDDPRKKSLWGALKQMFGS